MQKVCERLHLLLFPPLTPGVADLLSLSKLTGLPTPFDLQSCLMLADLAASESPKRTDARYQRLEECKFINLSLSALGNCVASLAKVCVSSKAPGSIELEQLETVTAGGN